MNNNTPTLPQELTVEILLRLPVRSLLRFKCVCKSWLVLISDPQFAKFHFDLAATPSHRFLLRAPSDGFIQAIDTEASLHDDSAVVKLTFPPPSPPRYEYDPPSSPKDAEILCSCRGLVLLYYYYTSDLILWNPSTGAYNRLSWPWGSSLTKEFSYGLAYDASTDDYLLILLAWKHDDSWAPRVLLRYFKANALKRIQDVIKYKYRGLKDQFRVGSVLNGAVHWLVYSYDKEDIVIVAFDLEEKTSSEIPLPPPATAETEYELYTFTVVEGCLSVCSSIQGRARNEIWVMKEYKVESSWTKYIVMSNYDIPLNHFNSIYFTKDGGILGSNLQVRLEKLGDKGEIIEHIMYVGDDGWSKLILQYDMYIESLLSPCLSMGEQATMTNSNTQGELRP